jgi:PIN domain nuclease of toxin-antitoxin system
MLGRRGKLGSDALRLYEGAERGEAVIHVPTLVLMEIVEAHERGRIRLPEPVHLWTAALFRAAGFRAVDLSVDIVLTAAELGKIGERRDRLIAATAVQLDLPLITRDHNITESIPAGVVW